MDVAASDHSYVVSRRRNFIRHIDALAANRAILFLALFAIAFLLRCANLGDWNYEVDDQYFSLVGHRMLAGDILYVDIFDRKSPALYLTYMALAAVSDSVTSYQLAGTVCIALAAYGIGRIATLLALPLAIAVSTAFVWISGELNFAERVESRREAQRIATYVKDQTPHRRLLVWGFPTYLYVLVDAKPPSALAFSPHLFDASEASSAKRDQVTEVRKILPQKPETVVVQQPLPARPLNLRAAAAVDAYLRTCTRVRSFMLRDHFGPQEQLVYSQCSGTEHEA